MSSIVSPCNVAGHEHDMMPTNHLVDMGKENKREANKKEGSGTQFLVKKGGGLGTAGKEKGKGDY